MTPNDQGERRVPSGSTTPTHASLMPSTHAESLGTLPGDALPMILRVAAGGDRTAVRDAAGELTYNGLMRASDVVAHAMLRGRRDLDGARIASLVMPGSPWAITQLGAWRAGGIAVPLALSAPVPELVYGLQDSGADQLVASAELRSAAETAAAQAGIPLLILEDASVTGGEAVRATDGSPQRDTDLSDGGALILYTSGTTGRPKGVLLTHANLEAQVSALTEAWEWTADDNVLLVLPLHHVHGIVNVVLCALWNGATCSVALPFDAAATWERISEGDLTLFMAVPTLYQRMLTAWDVADPATRERWSTGAARLRLHVSGSAALPAKVLEQWERITGHRLLERYGMTEIGMGLGNPLHGERRAGHVGLPFPGVQVRFVDEHGSPVPEGSPGEIEVKSGNVFREYWGRPADTRAAFTADGWFRTGDVATLENDSYRILGRTSVDIVKTGGEKVSALEVEETLREHPSVADCAVVGVADADWGERICVAIVPSADGELLTIEALRTWARERLSPWKVPKELRTVEALPRNVMGKVDKKAVKAQFG